MSRRIAGPGSRGAAALLALAALLGCRPASETPAVAYGLDLTTALRVDLSYTYDDDTLYWPTSPSRFELEELAHGPTEGGYFYSANRFRTPEHGGTHLDAPIHFAERRWTTEKVPLEHLIAPAVVIDVSDAARADSDYRLTEEDVAAWEREHGRVPAGAIALLRTGWGERWPDAAAYLGDDTPGDASNLHFPAFGLEAANRLIHERGVVGLGVDTASIDHGPSTDFPVHRLAAAANVFGLENVAHLEEMPATGAWLIALPVKIGRGSGGPVRIVGLVP